MGNTEALQEYIAIEGLDHLRYQNLYDRYRYSAHGLIHAAEGEARFSYYYFYGREEMIEDLGLDVHPVGHLEHTHNLTHQLITAQNGPTSAFEPFSEEEAAELRISALLHDIGECPDDSLGLEVIGDRAFNQKTLESEQAEAAIRNYFFETMYRDLGRDVLGRVEAIVTGDLASPERQQRALAVVERIGYYLSAINAGNIVLDYLDSIPYGNETSLDTRMRQLSRMAANVTEDWRDDIITGSKEFDYAQAILDDNKEADDTISKYLSKVGPLPL